MPPLSDLADAEIARRVQCGDAAAETELARRFAPRLRAFARRHLGFGSLGADLTQEVLLHTLARLRAGEVRQPEQIAAFVLGTARRVALAMGRSQRRAQALPVADEVEAAAAPGADVLAVDQLAGCLQQLGERERTVVLMTFHHDLGAEQIAGELSLQPGHVRVIRHRALQRLRSCMGVEVGA